MVVSVTIAWSLLSTAATAQTDGPAAALRHLDAVESRYVLRSDNGFDARVSGLLQLHRQLASSEESRRALLRADCDVNLAVRALGAEMPAGDADDGLRRCGVVDVAASRRGRQADLTADLKYEYDPVLMTLAAGLESRLYSRSVGVDWTTLNMPATQAGSYFRRPVRAYFRSGRPTNTYLFILAGSSYSTWRGGSWMNKTIAALDSTFPGAAFLCFPGFLTPEFLSAGPRIPELSGQSTAEDLYSRIVSQIDALQQAGALPRRIQIGAIGFSGGANIALSLLAEDARRGSAARFALGAIAFSPIVDLEGAFRVLDESSATILRAGFPATHGLTTMPDMFWPFLAGYRPGNLAPFLDLMRAGRDEGRSREFINRFYREFQVVDLQGVRRAPYATPLACPATSFGRFYADCVAPLYPLTAGSSSRNLNDYASFVQLVSPITTAPVYIVVAQDDPVLVRSSVADARANVVPALDAVAKRPNVRVFNPAKGAHMGYFLDSSYLRAAFTSFFESPK